MGRRLLFFCINDGLRLEALSEIPLFTSPSRVIFSARSRMIIERCAAAVASTNFGGQQGRRRGQ